MLRRMSPHGDRLCDDVLLCLITQPGRQAGQPNHRQHVRSPLTASTVFSIQYGQGALLVAQATATHMPCELWLHYCIEKYAPRTYVGRGGRHSESAQSVLLQCSAKLCS